MYELLFSNYFLLMLIFVSAALHIEPMQPFLLNMETANGTYNLYTRSLAFLSSCPDFFFSKFPLALNQHSLVSFTRWISLVGSKNDLTSRRYDSVEDIPKAELLIKVRDGLSDTEKKAFAKELEDFVFLLSTSDQPLKSYSFEGCSLSSLLSLALFLSLFISHV